LLLSTCSAPQTHAYTATDMPASTAQLSRTAERGKLPAPQQAAAPPSAAAAAMVTAEESSAADTTNAAAAAAAAAASATADAADTASAAESPADDMTASGKWAGPRPVGPPPVGGLQETPSPGRGTAAAIGARLTFQRQGVCRGGEAEEGVSASDGETGTLLPPPLRGGGGRRVVGGGQESQG